MEFGGRVSGSVDTVRALHQTILSLRAALEQSRSEVDELRARFGPRDVEDGLRPLSADKPSGNKHKSKRKDGGPKLKKQLKRREQGNSDCDSDTNPYVSTETIGSSKASRPVESISFVKTLAKRTPPNQRNLSKSKTVSFSNVSKGDRRISTTNSFIFKPEKIKTGAHRQSEARQPKKAQKNRQFSEEIIHEGHEVRLGRPQQNIVQEVDLKSTVQKSSVDLEEENTASQRLLEEIRLQKILHVDIEVQNRKDQDAKQTETAECIKEVHVQAIEDSEVETQSSNGVQKSTELGEVLESALFGDREKLGESQEDISLETGVNAQELEKIPEIICTVETSPEELETRQEQTSDKEEQEETEDKAKDDSDTSSTPCSSDGKTLNNVEVSVKIFKGPDTKPIEIDVQTKRIRKGKKKRKQTKTDMMNDKSQNTSFDNDGAFPQPRPTNVIQNSENIVQNLLQNDAEQEEVDDIELIFTTDDTKDADFKEELVSIEPYSSSQLLQRPQADYDEKAEVSDRELEDDVFNDNFEGGENCGFQSQTFDFRSQIYNSKSDNSINHEDKSLKSYYSSFENKSLEKDESFDRFEEKVRIVETDISKVGIQDVDYNMGRRNTCPNPLQYRPMMHREALGRGLNSRKCRPILAHSNVARKECGAQTDISAIPGSSWRSESSLAHKVKIGENFTTLPSKFPHPASKLRLSEKTVEARRVLLSDIGFTSMVPELSRSADHLFPANVKAPSTTTYGQFLRTSDLYSPGYTSQKFMWTTTATPSEGSHSQSRYSSSQYPLSSPPAPVRRCSAPVSPSRRTATLRSTPSRVRFANGSLPELRGDWTTTVDSGESTDSLVEEAEHFLRRSIDCLAPARDVYYRSDQSKGSVRRASAPEPTRDNVPPPGWQPFLPRVPRDLHLDYWVKVISQEGRVRGGRVRYVGPLMSQSDQFVGVQLSTPDGHSDGTFNNRRYFNCEPYHGIFVPFKKIIMGWRP